MGANVFVTGLILILLISWIITSIVDDRSGLTCCSGIFLILILGAISTSP
jgi:hypothetical protein